MKEPRVSGVPAPERHELPGGGHSPGFYDEDGHLREMVVFDVDGDEVSRIYNAPPGEPPPAPSP